MNLCVLILTPQWPAWHRAQNTCSIKACQCRPLIKLREPKTSVFKPSPLPSLLYHQPDSTVTIPSTEWFHFLIFELGLPHTDFSSLHLCSCSWLREALPFFSLIAIFQPLPPSLSAVRGTSLTSYFKFNCCFQPAMQTPCLASPRLLGHSTKFCWARLPPSRLHPHPAKPHLISSKGCMENKISEFFHVPKLFCLHAWLIIWLHREFCNYLHFFSRVSFPACFSWSFLIPAAGFLQGAGDLWLTTCI